MDKITLKIKKFKSFIIDEDTRGEGCEMIVVKILSDSLWQDMKMKWMTNEKLFKLLRVLKI